MHLDSSSNEERVGVEFYAHREVCVCVFSPPRRDSGIASGDQSRQDRAFNKDDGSEGQRETDKHRQTQARTHAHM